jgi:hypothetical protein
MCGRLVLGSLGGGRGQIEELEKGVWMGYMGETVQTDPYLGSHAHE